MNFKLREAKNDDVHFILNSWLTSYRSSEICMSSPIYFHHFKKIIVKILQRASVLVACNPEDEDHIYGYVVYEPQDSLILHCILVKLTYRGEGVATALLDAIRHQDDAIVCTFANSDFFFKLNTKWRLTYNPWLR